MIVLISKIMRIGIELTGALPGGGFRRYTEELLGALGRLPPDHEYFLYGVFWRGFPERATNLRVPQGKNFHWALKKFPQGLLFPLEEWTCLRYQERVLSGLSLDLVHGLGSMVPRLDRLKSVVTLHYARWKYDQLWEKFYFERLTERSVRQANKVIAISEFSRQEALKSWDLPPEKIAVVPHGDPGASFQPTTEKRDPLPGIARPYFLFVGGLVPQKNPALLAEAFGLLRSRHPDWSHRLVFVGPLGKEFARVKDILRRRNALEFAVFTGPAEQGSIHSLYQQAEAVVCPSPVEGFAFPALEAMACGAPVIGVRAGALVETIGQAGLLPEPEPEAMAAAMERVVAERDLREDMARRGLDRVRQFSWDETARKTVAVYEEAGR